MRRWIIKECIEHVPLLLLLLIPESSHTSTSVVRKRYTQRKRERGRGHPDILSDYCIGCRSSFFGSEWLQLEDASRLEVDTWLSFCLVSRHNKSRSIIRQTTVAILANIMTIWASSTYTFIDAYGEMIHKWWMIFNNTVSHWAEARRKEEKATMFLSFSLVLF